MKKVLIIAAAFFAAVVILLGIYTFGPLPDEYSGKFEFYLGGQYYVMPVETVNHYTNSNNREIYRVDYSDGTDSCYVKFELWREDGDIYIDVESPLVTVNGQRYFMRRDLRANDYDIDYYFDDSMQISFIRDLPYKDLNSFRGIFWGTFTLMNGGNDLI